MSEPYTKRPKTTWRVSHPYPANTFYGFERILQRHTGWTRPIKAIVPHGVLLNPFLVPTELRDWPLPIFLGYSWLSDDVAKTCRKEIEYSASPFLYFVDSVAPVASELRTPARDDRLLFFPTHSSGLYTAEASSTATVQRLLRLRAEGFSCTVCLYWRDLELGRGDAFLDIGFPVVSCGHREDAHFTENLVRFILDHDVIAGDSFGSHMFYGAYLGRSYFSVDHDEHGETRDVDVVLDKFLNDLGLSQLRIRSTLSGRVREHFRGMCVAFGTTEPGSQAEYQRTLTDEFLGRSNLLKRDELREILRRAERADVLHTGRPAGAPLSPLASRAARRVLPAARQAIALMRR